jgi:hypothetical protein
MPKETQPKPWTILITMAIIILYSTLLILYLMVAGRITPTPAVLVGNITVSQSNTLKVTVIAFGATYRITGITPSGGTCRLTGVFINNTQAPLTPPWILRNGQPAVFILSGCVNVSQVIVPYDNGRVLIIPVRG